MKLKRKIAGIATAAACFLNTFTVGYASLIAEAESSSDAMTYGDDLSYQQVDEDGDGTYDFITISKCDISAIEIIIPSEIDGLPVEKIGNYAFEDCTDLKSIKIADSVKIIGYGAFNDCAGLTSINIPDSMDKIEYMAFSGCSSLKSINIPESVTKIESSVFLGCTNLENINVSADNKNYCSIDGVLFNIDKTQLIAYPTGKKDAEYSIPVSVKQIGDFVFKGCKGLKSVTIPDGITKIESSLFSGCTSLVSVNIPDSVTEIGNYVFSNCISLKSIKLPDSVTTTAKGVFFKCTSLTSVNIPSGMTRISEEFFSGCTSLASIKIPDNIKSIGNEAFDGTALLENQTGVKYIDNWVVDCDEDLTSVEIKAGTRGISENAFAFNTNLVSVKIPDGVKEIGYSTFSFCRNLTNIELPSSVTSIGQRAFYNCTSLENLEIPDSVTSIEKYAFDGAALINNQIGVKYADSWVVKCDKDVKSVEIKAGTRGIAAGVFASCENLTSIKLPNGVVSIGHGAFEDCKSLTSINIPDSITSIEDMAFSNTALLKNQTGVKYVDKWVVGCDQEIASVKIKEGVKGIADGSFYELESVYIPDSVVFICDDAFECHYTDLAIFGNEGSAAQAYAEEHNFVFNPPKIGLGKIEYQLNYDGKINTYFSPNETGTYYIQSECTKYHSLSTNSCSMTSSDCINELKLECTAGEEYVITLEPYEPDSDWKDDYRWAEGDSAECSIWIFKEVTEEKRLSDLEEYTISANTKTAINFTVDELTALVVDTNDVEYYLYDSVDLTNRILHDYNYSLEKGKYTIDLDAVDKDTVIKIKRIADKSRLIYSKIDRNSDGIYEGLEVSGYEGSAENLVIPNEFNGLPVLGICAEAFKDCNSLKSIEIPESISFIYGCNGFSKAQNLENINVSKNNSKFSSIDGILFNKDKTTLISYPNAKKDVSYLIPNSVTKIGEYAFYDSDNLKNIKIPNSVTMIGWETFRYCNGLENVEIPNGVETIEQMAFDSCQNLKSIKILNSNCEIKNRAINNVYKDETPKFDGTIYGYKNSTAQTYAENNGFKFESLGKDPIVTTPAVTTTITTTKVSTKPTAVKTTKATTKPTAVKTTKASTKSTAVKTTKASTKPTVVKTTKASTKPTAVRTTKATTKLTVVTTTKTSTKQTVTTTPTTTAPITTTTPIVTYEKGDANSDGKISIQDARFIAKLIAKRKRDELPPWADFNGDGKCTIRDALDIARYIANRPR